MLKGNRVRLYSHELGNLYGTVAQDHQISGGQNILIHLDGVRKTDLRWIHKDLVWTEAYRGEYARSRVSECTSAE